MEETPRVVITGNGQLGRALSRQRDTGNTVLLPKLFLDITDSKTVLELLRALSPTIIVNAAAYNAVSRAEQERAQAFLVNHTAVGYLVDYCERYGATLIHFGTNYVYGGGAKRPYFEDDPTNPQTVYGQSKLAGETTVLIASVGYVLRTSAVWGDELLGSNLRAWLLRKLAENKSCPIDDSQTLSFTHVKTLVETTNLIVQRLAGGHPPPYGVYNVADDGYGTWFEFAQETAVKTGQENCFYPCAREDGVPRPAYSVLALEKWQEQFGVVPTHWREQIARSG